MRISEAADRCGLTVDTIRFYEKSGLLPIIARTPDGRRRFSAENVEWLELLSSLRSTGMAMRDMQRFASLYRAGEKTIPDRRTLLLDHLKHLEERRNALDHCAEMVAYKLKMYDEMSGEPE